MPRAFSSGLGRQRDGVGIAESAQDLIDQIQQSLDLPRDLIRGAEDVGIVLCEPAHAQHPVEHPAPLVPVTGPELGHTDRQIAVGALLRLVDGDVSGAVHGLWAVGTTLLHFERAEHTVLEVLEVPGDLENPFAHDVGRVDQVITVPEDQLLLESLDLASG